MGIDLNALCDQYGLFKYKQQLYTSSFNRKEIARQNPKVNFEKECLSKNTFFIYVAVERVSNWRKPLLMILDFLVLIRLCYKWLMYKV